ncbi:VOC family protein [Allorhizobium taibaishanense]|uniref:Catechol 2,3-dioxygenase-like lactoylglutathione lyase family enzyme n=1 Tax=Allorhizobium taibaishanense TaxID=887144 RepID=A0A1Q9A8Q4_9HYPH|nr:VOC family protein [Allorhizobium taibaishanense]MBB4009487.1 catechol 2,3-dioxygenase-like lactoylglutathione lyase family enzyme [Allorhizobium taibaishanense]OLP50973.1 extradiol dioxygenase [Allorhizobium taibaishanense]
MQNKPTKRIATVTLVVDDYDRALAFYCGKLGFACEADIGLGGGKRWVVVSPGNGAGLLLALAEGEMQRVAIGHQTGGRVAFFLETDDFARDHAAFIAAGVTFREDPRHEPYGTVAVFEDLYGNLWDLIERKL